MAGLYGINQTTAAQTAFIKQGASEAPSGTKSGSSSSSSINSSKAGACTSFLSYLAFPFKKIGEAFIAAVKFFLCIRAESAEDRFFRYTLHLWNALDVPPAAPRTDAEKAGVVAYLNSTSTVFRQKLADHFVTASMDINADDDDAEVARKMNAYNEDPDDLAFHQRILDGEVTTIDVSDVRVTMAVGRYQNELINEIGTSKAQEITSKFHSQG